MGTNVKTDEIEWRDPYADFYTKNEVKAVTAADDEKSLKTVTSVDEKKSLKTVTSVDYTAKEIYDILNGTAGEPKAKVSISASLSVFDKSRMDEPVTSGEIAFGNATVDLQRREDTIQIKIEPQATDTADVKTFWNLLEEYGETTEKLYEDENILVMLFIYIIPMDMPYMFMGITNPLFWALQKSRYDGGNQQIRMLVPAQMVEFSVSNLDEKAIEREVDAEIDAETDELIHETVVLKKEIAKMEEQNEAEEIMEEFKDNDEEDTE